MTDENIDRKLHELMGRGCLHEWDYTNEPESMVCEVCKTVAMCYTDDLPNPSYSTSISDAMEAVEAVMTERRWVLSMGGGTDFAFAGKIRYHVEVGQTWEEGGAVFEAEHESLPTAITLGLIEALEAK